MYLSFIGLYPEAINNVVELCESALYEAGCSEREISDMYENAKKQLNETADFDNLTNCIIEALFTSTALQLKEKGIAVEYYVNCDDSHLYIVKIDGDER